MFHQPQSVNYVFPEADRFLITKNLCSFLFYIVVFPRRIIPFFRIKRICRFSKHEEPACYSIPGFWIMPPSTVCPGELTYICVILNDVVFTNTNTGMWLLAIQEPSFEVQMAGTTRGTIGLESLDSGLFSYRWLFLMQPTVWTCGWTGCLPHNRWRGLTWNHLPLCATRNFIDLSIPDGRLPALSLHYDPPAGISHDQGATFDSDKNPDTYRHMWG